MTVSKTRAFRPMLMAFAVLALSACTTTMANSPNAHSMKDGCCSDMRDGKACGCCGGGGDDTKPMMCQPKS